MSADNHMSVCINAYLDHIRADYLKWAMDKKIHSVGLGTMAIEEGSKYLKVVRHDGQTMVHSFIVRKDTERFKKGDILKAATWSAPATNFVRGNIFKGDFSRIRWTGAN